MIIISGIGLINTYTSLKNMGIIIDIYDINYIGEKYLIAKTKNDLTMEQIAKAKDNKIFFIREKSDKKLIIAINQLTMDTLNEITSLQ
jgi:hypothetical protein